MIDHFVCNPNPNGAYPGVVHLLVTNCEKKFNFIRKLLAHANRGIRPKDLLQSPYLN